MAEGNDRVIGGKYRLGEILGEGAIGVVWRAHDESLGRDVAVKEIRLPAGIDDDRVRALQARALREARAAARLTHFGSVVIHEVVREGGRPWIVMELVRGRTLQQIVRDDGPLPPVRAAEIGGKILAALRAAHAAGVVHRDVKPSNVMLADERVVLTDFGIAALDDGTILTQTGAVIGTPAFMAPEQARGQGATPASDLWSLGATLYAAVEGHSPFEGDNVAAMITALLTNDPPPPRLAGPLAPVLSGLLAKDPGQRMRAEEVETRLAAIARDAAPHPTQPVVPPSRRGVAMVGIVAAAAVLITVAMIWLPRRSESHTTPRATASAVRPALHAGQAFPSVKLASDTNIFSIAFSPDGSTLACGASDSTVRLWDARRRRQTTQLPGHSDAVESVAFSSDGKRLATAGDDETARLWDLTSGTQIAKLGGFGADVWSVDLSPDGRTLASGSKDGTIHIWDVATRTQTHVVHGHTDGVTTLAFSPDGRTLASGAWDDTVRLWTTNTWTQSAILRGHTDSVHSVAFTPDGKTLASGSDDEKVLLWDVATHRGTGVFTGHKGQVAAVAFSPDGRTLASSGKDDKIMLYDVASGARLAALTGHTGNVDSIAFSPDGKTLASGAEDKSIRLWDLTR